MNLSTIRRTSPPHHSNASARRGKDRSPAFLSTRRAVQWTLLAASVSWIHGYAVFAQISLSSALNLALTNDNRVKLAEADVAKARAILAESKDAFVPAIAATGGVGKSTGAPLSPPVVFSMAAQSLVYNASQTDYVRAAHAGVESAQVILDGVRSDVAEDVATTYITLDSALERLRVERDALDFASQLVRITQERFDAGLDSHLELTKARRTEVQLRLGRLLVEDEVTNQTNHLASLTGLPAGGLRTDHAAIPPLQAPLSTDLTEVSGATPLTGTSAAFSIARAKQLTAQGDRRYLLRPQVAFSANYARISTAFTNYEQYYPRFGANNNSFNSLSVGVQLTLPLLDMVHRAKARESAADAAHSLYEARVQQVLFLEGRTKLRRSTAELYARRDLAGVEHDLAQDQLDAVTLRLQAAAATLGGEQLSPKDEANARLGERQRALDMLSANLQLMHSEVMLMRQDGSLTNWLATSLPSVINGPGSSSPNPTQPAGVVSPPVPATAPALPPTLGAEPATASPGVASPAPAPAPTTGTAPASLPSSPVIRPAPASPGGPPPPQ